MDAEKAFRRLSSDQKLEALKAKGDYVGSRFHSAYHIHLFAYEGMFVEVWYKIGLNLIHFIEIQKNKDILALYADKVDVYRDLDISPND